MQQDAKTRTLDEALAACDEHVEQHRRRARLVLMILFQVAMLALIGLGGLIGIGSLGGRLTDSSIDTTMLTGALLFLSALIAVLVSLYRFHLVEISRNEHYRIGFMRIRVAANNTGKGFAGEVRSALTEDAFRFEPPGRPSKNRVESPVPGHPTSDLTALVLSKLLDQVDLGRRKTDPPGGSNSSPRQSNGEAGAAETPATTMQRQA